MLPWLARLSGIHLTHVVHVGLGLLDHCFKFALDNSASACTCLSSRASTPWVRRTDGFDKYDLWYAGQAFISAFELSKQGSQGS